MNVALLFPQRAGQPVASRLGWWVCHLLEIFSLWPVGWQLEVSPKADSPCIHRRPLAYFLLLLPATVGQVLRRKKQGTSLSPKKDVIEREGVLASLISGEDMEGTWHLLHSCNPASH